MKMNIFLPVFLGLGMAVCLVAQSESDFSGWMKDVAKTKGAVTKAVKGNEAPEAATQATHLAGLFGQVAAYFTSHNMSDAAQMAKQAQSNATSLASAAKAGNEAQMATDLMAVGAACGECHMAHRGGQAPNFTIK